MFKTPILSLIFNRPDTTALVFERIREAKPSQLFVAADGPRPDKPEAIEKCRAAREREIIIKGVDWDCELKTLFRDENLDSAENVSFFDLIPGKVNNYIREPGGRVLLVNVNLKMNN